MYLVWNTVVYAGGVWLLGVPLWKAIVVGLVASATLFLQYGSRWVSRFGFGLMIVAILVWVEALPTPDHWTEGLRYIRVAIFQS
jgi:hypothetical protein